MGRARCLVPFAVAMLALGCMADPTSSTELSVDQAALSPEHEAQVVPHGQAQAELLKAALSDAAHGAATATPWECDPELYGFTPVPDMTFRLPNESESTSGLLVGWPSWGCVLPELTELVRHSVGHAQVTVVVPEQFQQSAVACMRRRGMTDEQLDLIDWVNAPVSSVWMRDYGPEVVLDEDDQRHLVDMSYYPSAADTCHNLGGRSADDAIPTHLGSLWQLPVHRPQVRFEGGNILSDGAGHCFRARDVANLANCFSRWCYTEEELNDLLGAQLGCEVVSMDSMVGDVIDHIDMWMAFLSPRTVLVGRYDPADDPDNAAILDGNAARLESLGYRVARVPMPTPWCKKSLSGCIGKEHLVTTCDHKQSARVWATYTNSIRVGDQMIVPVFHWVPEAIEAQVAAQEQEALATYQVELDREFGAGAVTVVPVASDVIIPCQGTFHCISMTY